MLVLETRFVLATKIDFILIERKEGRKKQRRRERRRKRRRQQKGS